MMSNSVVADDGLKALPGGCSITIRSPWYRSLPLSVYEVIAVAIDGQPVPLDRVRFAIEGEAIALDALPARTGEMWFVRDDAYLTVDDVPVERGSAHDVAVTLALYPPYIPGYKRITRTEKRLQAR